MGTGPDEGAALAGYDYPQLAVTMARPHVAHVEMRRPGKLNAFHRQLWLDFGRLFGRLSAEPRVRVVVLSGAGDRAFCAGLDLQAMSSSFSSSPSSSSSADGGQGSDGHNPDPDPARRAKTWRGHISEFQACIGEMERCEKPVICVMHGISLGLAIDIACCADIRICAADSRFAVKEVDIGLAADIGTLARLPKIVGSTSWVKEVCLSARDFGAHEALAVGFVSRVHEDKARALEAGLAMAQLLAEKSPVAVQGTKELLNYGREHGTADSLRYTTVWNSVALQAGDLPAALEGSIKRTVPRFEKL